MVLRPTKKIPVTPITANTHDHIYLDLTNGIMASQGQIIDSGNSCALVVITIDVSQSEHS